MGRAADEPHPASLGEDESADAVPFIPYCSSPFPKRPREVICEMLGFGLKVDVASHNSLGSPSLPGALFVKRTRALLHVCRQGQLRPHLEEALDQNLVRQGGEFITPIQLCTWGRKVGVDMKYAANVKKRKRSTLLAVAAPNGFNSQEVALIKLHEEVKSLWKAQQSRIIAQRHQMISDMQRQLHDMLLAKDETLRALKAAWDPVSRFPEMKESDMLTRCYQKLEHESGQERPFHGTDNEVLEAKAKHEEAIQHEALLAYYSDDADEAKLRGLSDLCRRQVGVFTATVGQRRRFTRLLAEANLPSDATVL